MTGLPDAGPPPHPTAAGRTEPGPSGARRPGDAEPVRSSGASGPGGSTDPAGARDAPRPAPAPQPECWTGDGPRLVVAGVDGTPSAWRAFAWACGHARRSRCPVLAIFASTPSYLDSAMPNTLAVGAVTQAVNELAEQLRAEVCRAGADFGVPVRFEHRRGEPARVLLGAADEHNADLVVIGASASALHRLTGSLAGRLARSRKVPVVVVP